MSNPPLSNAPDVNNTEPVNKVFSILNMILFTPTEFPSVSYTKNKFVGVTLNERFNCCKFPPENVFCAVTRTGI